MFKLFSGSAAIRISGAAAQLLLTILVSRLCGANETGLFFFGFSILMIVSTLVRLGSELSGLRDSAYLFELSDARQLKQAVDSRIIVVVGIGLLCSISMFISAPTIATHTYGPSALPILKFTALTIPALGLVGLMSEVLKGTQHMWLALTVQNVAIPMITSPMIAISLIFRQPDAALVSGLNLASTFLVAIVALLAWMRILRKRFGHVGRMPRPTVAYIRQTLKDSPSLLAISMTPVVMQWVGAALLGFLAPASEVAGFSIAVRISIAVSIVHSAAASVVGPQMSVAHATGDIQRLRHVSQQTALLISVITLPALIVMMLIAPVLMSIFGPSYGDYAYILRILIVGQLVAALIGHSGMVLVMSGKYSGARSTSLIAAFSLAALSFAFIPEFGGGGVALAMAGAVGIGHSAAVLLVHRELGFWTFPTSFHAMTQFRSSKQTDPTKCEHG